MSLMRMTIAIDDELLAKAQRLTGIREKDLLICQALQTLVERESARRLAQLGGTEPNLRLPPRRRQA